MKIFMILGVIVAAFVVFAIVDSKEMERQNCQRTGNSREDIIWQYIYDAKGNVMSCQCILRLLLSMNINAMTVTGGDNNELSKM